MPVFHMFWKDCAKDKYREQMEDIFICLSSLNLSYESWMEVEFDAFFLVQLPIRYSGHASSTSPVLLECILYVADIEWFNVIEYSMEAVLSSKVEEKVKQVGKRIHELRCQLGICTEFVPAGHVGNLLPRCEFTPFHLLDMDFVWSY